MPNSIPSDFKTCLLELLYYKDCITTRQSWLFSFYAVINKNNKQNKMKLENITIIFHSITYYHPFFHYTAQFCQIVCPEFLSSEEVGLDLGFSSVAESAVGNILSDILIHTLPVILAFYKTIGVSVSLMT